MNRPPASYLNSSLSIKLEWPKVQYNFSILVRLQPLALLSYKIYLLLFDICLLFTYMKSAKV